MGRIIDFASRGTISKTSANTQRQDAYLDFLRHVVATAHACGFAFAHPSGTSAEHLYANTRHRSQLAKLLADRR